MTTIAGPTLGVGVVETQTSAQQNSSTCILEAPSDEPNQSKPDTPELPSLSLSLARSSPSLHGAHCAQHSRVSVHYCLGGTRDHAL